MFPVWQFHILLILSSTILSNLFDFYFASRLHFIEKCSILIQRKLISYNATTKDGMSMKLLREMSVELWRLSESLNERFAYSLLTSVTSKLAMLVVHIYWVYMRTLHGNFNFEFVRK